MSLGNLFCYDKLHSDSNKAQKELNQNVNWKVFSITGDYFKAIQRQILKFTCSLIDVLCKPMAVLMSRDAVMKVKKNSGHIYRYVALLLV